LPPSDSLLALDQANDSRGIAPPPKVFAGTSRVTTDPAVTKEFSYGDPANDNRASHDPDPHGRPSSFARRYFSMATRQSVAKRPNVLSDEPSATFSGDAFTRLLTEFAANSIGPS
jgi:hypothetical protein